MRKPIIAGNWKLHKTLSEALALVDKLKNDLASVKDVEIVVAPVFTALATVARAANGSNIEIAAQNCYPAVTGAFTGEVSPTLLKDAGCRSIIIGHSERRQLFGENDALINTKIKTTHEAGLRAIFCIGETLAEREGGRMFDVLKRQVSEGLKGVDTQSMQQVVIAYEPVWAIGTGKVASNKQAQEAHAFVRNLVREQFGDEVAAEIRILYGGSVKPDNVDGLMAMPDVDGALVGGASLKAEDFVRIVRFNKG